MKKISLSEVEVNDLIDLYQSEIDRAQRRISNLKSIIKKISDGKNVDASEEKPEKVKRGRKPNAKAPVEKIGKELTTEPKKRGRKPKAKVSVIKAEKEITSEPKKRGRKPKVKEVTAKAEPKRRGRKPKVNLANTPAKAEVAKKVVAKEPKKKVAKLKEKPAPKKRGRKPKTTEAKAVENKAEVKVVEKKAKPKVSKKKIVKAEPKKRGRKPKSLRKPIKGGKGKDKVKWNDFIFESLSLKNTLLPASAITQAAIEKFEIHESDRDRVRMAISTTLTKMANKDKVLKTYSIHGVRGSYFGLSTWFKENELKEEYKKKLS